MAECDHLAKTSAYFDGELPEAEHPELLAHLATCAECQSLLGASVSLDAAASRAAKVVVSTTTRRPRWGLVAGGAGVAAAAAIALWFARKPPPSEKPQQLAALELPKERAVEVRFSGDMFKPYRPRAVLRGDTKPHEPISLAVLAELEKRGDKRDLVAALASSGDVTRAQEIAALLPEGAETASDRAALALLAGDSERAIGDAFRAVDGGSPLAWWNLGLAARDLQLPRLARDAFEHVAKSGDAGWSKDASALAAADPQLVREEGFGAFFQAGNAMLTGGAKLDASQASTYPGYARSAFYDALHAAASRDDVEALRPLARALDAVSGTSTASAAADRVAATDFAVRKKFVADYRALATGTLPADRTTKLLQQLAAAGPQVADMYIGALVAAGQVGQHVDEFRKITAPWKDPWFDLQLERERIAAAFPGFDLRAEPALVHALDGCTNPAWAMRCGMLAQDLATLLFMTGRDDEAQVRARSALDFYTVAMVPPLLSRARSLLADIHRRHGRFGLARAELEEVVRAAGDGDPALRRYALIDEANVAFMARDLAAVRTLLPAPADPCCPGTDPLGLVTAVDLARMSGDAKDVERARAWIARAHETGDEASATISGARIDASQIDAMQKWLATFDKQDENSRGLRTWAFATLITDAGSHAQWAHVIELARTEHRVADAPCMVAASSDDDRLTVAIHTPDGDDGEASKLDVSAGGVLPQIVSARLVGKLKACAGIAVIARPPLHGRGDLLPPELPWWFAGDGKPVANPPPADRSALQVIDPRPPDPSLPRLPALAASKEKFDVTVAAGDATPARVLAALGDATYAELHAHGIVAAADTDAAYLALSPDPAGVYTLRADAIEKARFASAPIVVLAACRAAVVAPLLRQRWSLPDAFLVAGARAVIAADIAIPDQEAREVFDDLHRRITSGAPIAKALAELRAARGGWASHLMLFQ